MRVTTQKVEPGGWGAPARPARAATGPRWLAVLHVTSTPISAAQTSTADVAETVDTLAAGGAGGVFLVNERLGHQTLLRLAREIARAHPRLLFGVCCRDLRPQDVFCRVSVEVAAAWCPPEMLTPGEPPSLAAIARARRESGWPGLLFGGLFAHRARPGRLSALALWAELLDVIVIEPSGARGHPNPAQLTRMQATLPDNAFALAFRARECPSAPPALRRWPLLEGLPPAAAESQGHGSAE